jgi:hypothetical protein
MQQNKFTIDNLYSKNFDDESVTAPLLIDMDQLVQVHNSFLG